MMFNEPSPGQFLKNGFMKSLNISEEQMAKDLCLSKLEMEHFLLGNFRMSHSLALELSKQTGNSVKFWKNLDEVYIKSAVC